MSKIAILADSGCQIELDKYENQGVFIVPLCITFENKTYLDQVDIHSEEVFHIMEEKGIMVMTSQPSVGELAKALEKIKAAGYEEVVGISIATGLSSTLNGMNLAADLAEIPITLVDSKATAGIHKYLVETAMKLVKVGKTSSQIKEILELRFGLNGKEELTQKEVADLLGISQSYISRLEKKILKKLKNKMIK